MRRRILIVFNPVAGGGAKRFRMQRTLAKLTLMGCDLTLRATARRGDAERIAAETQAADFDALVAAGGDGTIHEVANGLHAGSPPLALLPLGTANVLAHEIGLKARSTPIAATIARGRETLMRCGRIDGRRFVLMAGAGFDAAVVKALDPRLKRALGKLAYAIESLRQMAAYSFPPLTPEIDGQPATAASILILNGRRYAGPYVCAPDGGLAKAGFQVVLFEASGRFAVLRYGLALLLDRLPRASGIRILPASSIRLAAPAGAPVQADGDWVAELPLSLTVDPLPVRLLVPDF
jgi:YegS/Rv2252/BmrU family lipid kinase